MGENAEVCSFLLNDLVTIVRVIWELKRLLYVTWNGVLKIKLFHVTFLLNLTQWLPRTCRIKPKLITVASEPVWTWFLPAHP